MKKNTLLYLDSELVDKAKAANINISRFVENALRQELRASLPETAHEYLQKVVTDTSQEGSSFYGEAYRLPFQIESLKLRNVGLFKNFEIDFQKDAMNLICGPNSSGKSTIIRSILLVFGKQHEHFALSKNGEVTLKLFPEQSSISLVTSDKSQELMNGYQCLIADDILQTATADVTSALFQELSKLKIQSIITASTLPKNTNLLKL